MPFVRPADIRDLGVLQEFDQFNCVTAEVLASGSCIVAGFEDEVLAYATVTRNFFNRRFVEFLFVHPDHRRKGVADVLLEFAERQVPGEALWISIALGNFPVQSLLHRRGYKHSGVVNDLSVIPELIYHKPAVGG